MAIFTAFFEGKMFSVHHNGVNNIQNFHLGRYIVRYTVRTRVLPFRSCEPLKLKFLTIHLTIYLLKFWIWLSPNWMEDF